MIYTFVDFTVAAILTADLAVLYWFCTTNNLFQTAGGNDKR